MNPLANMFGQRRGPQQNTNNMFDRFSEFASNFQGDPKQKVMELIQNGRMSQQQFNQLSQMAKLFQNRR